ncbi:MAG: c-type cytochrome [Alphaproteobacteria bacterium]|nr:c-type cytochrome [Alphaproteobacteria bacterium]MCW5741484.1 c-type cytochrome [Alphaproteobacteria bacterium]
MTMKRIFGALLSVSACVALAMPARAQSGQAMAQTCYVCHGPGAKGSGQIVALAGLPRDHLARQMSDFKADKRPGTIMNRIAKGYTDEQLALIAAYLAALK